jgi:hypothetical protein
MYAAGRPLRVRPRAHDAVHILFRERLNDKVSAQCATQAGFVEIYVRNAGFVARIRRKRVRGNNRSLPVPRVAL